MEVTWPVTHVYRDWSSGAKVILLSYQEMRPVPSLRKYRTMDHADCLSSSSSLSPVCWERTNRLQTPEVTCCRPLLSNPARVGFDFSGFPWLPRPFSRPPIFRAGCRS